MRSVERSKVDVTELEGTVFREYEIQKVVGQGGMAIVYQALDRRLDSLVAIKFLLPEYSRQDHVRKRFLDEARLQFKLRHPNLVRVTSLIEEGTLAGVVMDLVEGCDLAKILRDEKHVFTLGEIQEIFLQVLDAVGYAHDQKIIHRDLKPSNILAEKRGSGWHAYVMDFGIAKSLEENGGQTQTGSFLGSPHYASPEQIKGDKALDHRSDIYALGCTLYEVLTGAPPYGGKETLHQILFAHVMEAPPPLKGIDPSVGMRLERCIAGALAKDRDQRYPTCEAFAQEITRTFTPLQDRLPPFQKKHPSSDVGHVGGHRFAGETSPLDSFAGEKGVQETSLLSTSARQRSPLPRSAPASTRVLWAVLLASFGLGGLGAWLLWSPPTETPAHQPSWKARVDPPSVRGNLASPRAQEPFPYPRDRSIPPDLSKRRRAVFENALESKRETPSQGKESEVIRVLLESKPKAKVFQGKEEIGETPLTLEGTAGERRSLRLEAKGYQSRTISATFQPGSSHRFYSLSPSPPTKKKKDAPARKAPPPRRLFEVDGEPL